MWIMTSYGILMPATIPADVRKQLRRSSKRKQEWTLQVRSREPVALGYLRNKIKNMGGDVSTVRATPELDYEYRIYTTHYDYARIVQQEILEIDYDKFKPTTDRPGVGAGPRLHSLYNRIWGVVYDCYNPSARVSRRRKRWYEDI